VTKVVATAGGSPVVTKVVATAGGSPVVTKVVATTAHRRRPNRQAVSGVGRSSGSPSSE
jgi:hypothetical protein